MSVLISEIDRYNFNGYTDYELKIHALISLSISVGTHMLFF